MNEPNYNLAPVITGGLQQDRCVWCDKLLREHADELNPNAIPGIPCLGLKSGFIPSGTSGGSIYREKISPMMVKAEAEGYSIKWLLKS